jgi:hypothetical protein
MRRAYLIPLLAVSALTSPGGDMGRRLRQGPAG